LINDIAAPFLFVNNYRAKLKLVIDNSMSAGFWKNKKKLTHRRLPFVKKGRV